jgi:hypothetical protein
MPKNRAIAVVVSGSDALIVSTKDADECEKHVLVAKKSRALKSPARTKSKYIDCRFCLSSFGSG